jgi:cell division transport system permease protein
MREGAKNVVRNGWMSFASASAIAISLFILGVFLLLAMNVSNLTKQIESQVEIRVHLDVNMQEDDIASLQNEIGSIPGVSQVTFVSKEEGMEQLKETLGEDADLLEGYEGDNNPLPDSFTVKVQEPTEVQRVAAELEKMNESKNPPPFFKIYYGQGTVETLFKVTNVIRNIGLILVAGLAFTAMFLIANTIKLTILARQREIAIMKLVGATNSFIRWPFFVEGALLGIIGSLIPVAVLLYGYAVLVDWSRLELGLMLIQLIPVEEIGLTVAGLLFGIGIVIGIWGSTISVRKYLKV